MLEMTLQSVEGVVKDRRDNYEMWLLLSNGTRGKVARGLAATPVTGHR